MKIVRVRACAWAACLLGAVCCVTVAQGVDFPSAEGGVLTLTAPGEYASAVPGGVTKLVVNVHGTATLATTAAYKGTVEICAGSTLTVPNRTVLADAPITVLDGGTLYATFESAGQWLPAFKEPITIAGAGNGGIGAFKYGGPGKVMADSIVNRLVLAADATIDCSTRWGVSKTAGDGVIDLAGHTLTRIGGNAFMFVSATMTPGTFRNTAGTITFQNTGSGAFGVAEGHTGDETLIDMTGGSLSFWNTSTPMPYKVRFSGGSVYAGSGNGPDRNLISGPVEIEETLEIGSLWEERSLGFMGPVTIAKDKWLYLTSSGTLCLGGPITGDGTRLHVKSMGLIRIVAEDAGYRDFVMNNGRFELDGGRALVHMLRCANGGASFGSFYHKRGDLSFRSGDQPRIGESSGSFGTYTFDAGGFYPSNSVLLAEKAGSRGFFRQRGGHFDLKADAQTDTYRDLRIAGCNAQACFVQTGGTNDTLYTRVAGSSVTRTRFGSWGGTNLLFAVAGSNTLFRTDGFSFGCATNRTIGVIALNDGAAFKARRFYGPDAMAEGSDITLSINGGALYPLFVSGWANIDSNKPEFLTTRVPQHVIVGPQGVVIDSSECLSHEGKPGASHLPLTFTAPEGRGIASISLPAEVTNVAYYGAVAVEIEGPAGSYGASAYGEWDAAANMLKEIVVTSAGCNYDETTKIYVRGPTTGTTRYECAYTLTGVQTSGPLVKRGANALYLFGANTYQGGTIVESGALVLKNNAFPANTPLTVRQGALLDPVSDSSIRVSRLAGQGRLTHTTVDVSEALEVDVTAAFADGATPLVSDRPVRFEPGATVRLALTPGQTEELKDRRPVPVLTASELSGTPTLEIAGDTGDWLLLKAGNTLRIGPRKGLCIVIR